MKPFICCMGELGFYVCAFPLLWCLLLHGTNSVSWLELKECNGLYYNPLQTGKHTPPFLFHSVNWLQFPLCESSLTNGTGRYCCCMFLSFSNSHEMNQQDLQVSHRSFLPRSQVVVGRGLAGWEATSSIWNCIYSLSSKATRYFFKLCSNHLVFGLKQVLSHIFALVPCLCMTDSVIFPSWCPWLKIATSTKI